MRNPLPRVTCMLFDLKHPPLVFPCGGPPNKWFELGRVRILIPPSTPPFYFLLLLGGSEYAFAGGITPHLSRCSNIYYVQMTVKVIGFSFWNVLDFYRYTNFPSCANRGDGEFWLRCTRSNCFERIIEAGSFCFHLSITDVFHTTGQPTRPGTSCHSAALKLWVS